MVRNLYREKIEYYTTRLNTKLGLWDLFIGTAIWGFIIVQHKDTIYNYIFNILNFLPQGFIQNYFSYLIFGLVLMPLGLIITYILTKIYDVFFKNGIVV